METTIEKSKATSPATLTGTASRWTFDPAHTSVTFGVRHMMVATVRGEFQKATGNLIYDPTHPEATEIEAVIDVASVNTREPKRDAHLRSADFFDVEKFPLMKFRGRGLSRRSDGSLELKGDLTIRDTTRQVVLEVDGPTPEHKDPFGGTTRMGASAKTVIKRSDFGMQWNVALEAGGFLVGDEIKIQLDVELEKQP